MPVIYRQRFALLYHQLHALFQHLRNYCFTIIIISLNYRLSIIFTKLSRKTNGTTRFTSCPLPGTKVTICPRSIHRIPNQPYFHVTFTLRFRKVTERRNDFFRPSVFYVPPISNVNFSCHIIFSQLIRSAHPVISSKAACCRVEKSLTTGEARHSTTSKT